MRFCISFGRIDLKYLIYCILYLIMKIIFYLAFYYEESNIIYSHNFLESSCIFLGYLLNFFPGWISNRNSKAKKKPITNGLKKEKKQSFEYIYNKPYNEYLSTKEIIKFFFISLFLLVIELLKIIQKKIINKDENESEYENHFILIEFLIILIIPHSSEVYYKHQKFSFFIFTIIQIIKIIYFLFEHIYKYYLAIFMEIIISILFAFYCIYIKGLMEIKFISPYKCNFLVGIFNFPLIIIIYIIISFTPLGEKNKNYYVDNFFNLFAKGLDIINAFRLISFPFIYGISVCLFNKIIYDFTLYHSYIPLLIENFIIDIFSQIKNENKNENKIIFIVLIPSFIIELIMILVFMEIIELHFCGLNKDLKKNIELRALNETYLEIEDYNNNEVHNETNAINNENN